MGHANVQDCHVGTLGFHDADRLRAVLGKHDAVSFIFENPAAQFAGCRVVIDIKNRLHGRVLASRTYLVSVSQSTDCQPPPPAILRLKAAEANENMRRSSAKSTAARQLY